MIVKAQAFQAVGRVENFRTDAVGGHFGNTLVLVLCAAGHVVWPLPAKIGGAVLKNLWYLLFPKSLRLDDV